MNSVHEACISTMTRLQVIEHYSLSSFKIIGGSLEFGYAIKLLIWWLKFSHLPPQGCWTQSSGDISSMSWVKWWIQVDGGILLLSLAFASGDIATW